MTAQLPRGLFNIGLKVIASDVPGAIITGLRPQQINPAYQSNEFSIQAGDARLEQGHDDERYEFNLTVAGWPQDALAAMAGSTVVTTGTGGTLESLLVVSVNDTQPHFQLLAQQKDSSGGDTTYTFPNCQLNGKPGFTANQGEYTTPEVPIVAYPATAVVAAAAGPPAIAAIAVGDLIQINQRATFAALA